MQEGLDKQLIDRIYRSLFVFSIGFNEIIRTVVQHSKHSFKTTTYIWKAFSVLLEYSCQIDHKMMIEHAEELNKEEINKFKAQVQSNIDDLEENNKALKSKIRELQMTIDDLEKQKFEQSCTTKHYEEEIQKHILSNEKEIKVRLQFERKLNSLHALHRDLESKYQQALKEIEKQSSNYDQLNDNSRQTLAKMNSLTLNKVEIENKANIIEERVYVLRSEMSYKDKTISELTDKLEAAIREKDVVFYKINVLTNSVKLFEEKIKILQDKIAHLEIERSTVIESSQRNERLYKLTHEELEKLKARYSETEIQFQKAAIDIAEINEVKRDREERISELRGELILFTKKYNNLEGKHNKLNMLMEELQNDRNQLKEEHEKLNKEYHLVTLRRNELEQILEEQNDNLKLHKDELEILRKEKNSKVEKVDNSKDEQIEELKATLESKTEAMASVIKNLQNNLIIETESKEEMIEKYKSLKTSHDQQLTDIVVLKTDI